MVHCSFMVKMQCKNSASDQLKFIIFNIDFGWLCLCIKVYSVGTACICSCSLHLFGAIDLKAVRWVRIGYYLKPSFPCFCFGTLQELDETHTKGKYYFGSLYFNCILFLVL